MRFVCYKRPAKKKLSKKLSNSKAGTANARKTVSKFAYNCVTNKRVQPKAKNVCGNRV